MSTRIGHGRIADLDLGEFMEENALMPLKNQSDELFRRLLKQCGYSGYRLESGFKSGAVTYPFVGFATSQRDMDSACIAVVDGADDPKAAVRLCYELAAPVVWVRHNGTVDWWIQRKNEPERFNPEPLRERDFENLVIQNRNRLDPLSIYRGKTIARIDPNKQLDFVDVGLLPLRREEAGKKLGDLVEDMTRATLDQLGPGTPSKATVRVVFTSIFRLLTGKILKDKAVASFGHLDLNNPREVLDAVNKHYSAANTPPSTNLLSNKVLKPAATTLAASGSFAVVSPESLAYVYEHTLVTKELRKELGIHATPPWLVDYMVWQLYDWIREIPVQDRHVFEPACGHAPFLLAMMRLLRMEMQDESNREVHNYLQARIHGMEIDDFAREIARLSLTLADIPNPNGWNLKDGDMFASDTLMREAARSRILLSNPPFESFHKSELAEYHRDVRPSHSGKALELLNRSLPHLRENAVFGLVLPQGILHSTQAKPARELLLRDFELREICLFADKVFEEGEPESVIILGRRIATGETTRRTVRYRRVREDGISRFASTYRPDSDLVAGLELFASAPDRSFRFPELPDVWTILHDNPRLSTVADVGQGFSFARSGLITEARVFGNRKFAGAIPSIIDGHTHINVWEIPKTVWLSEARTPIAPWRSGNFTGQPQVLVNYVRAMRGPWRIKALIDRTGHAVINTYNTIRPKAQGPPVELLWAILNSPIANAHIYCNTMRKHNYDTLIAELPLPHNWRKCKSSLVAAAEHYRSSVVPKTKFELHPESDSTVSRSLLALDAEVLKLYDLPPRLEYQLLDLFTGVQRRGVGCDFRGYYPPGLTTYVPLHELISEDYARSTLGRFRETQRTVSPDVLAALRTATESFGEE